MSFISDGYKVNQKGLSSLEIKGESQAETLAAPAGAEMKEEARPRGPAFGSLCDAKSHGPQGPWHASILLPLLVII